MVSFIYLWKGDCIVVLVGDIIFVDGEVLEGVVLVDEFVIMGELVLVLKELGFDVVSFVMGGICIIFDELIIWVIVDFGKGFIDCMIDLVEGVECSKIFNEIVLMVLLVVLILVFLIVVVILFFLVNYIDSLVSIILFIVFLVVLIFIIIGGLLSVIGIVGMDWVV